MRWPPRLEFGICDRLVARFAPREENAVYLLMVRHAKARIFGLRDNVLIWCSLAALTGLLNEGLAILPLCLPMTLLVIWGRPVLKLVEFLRTNQRGVDLMAAPITSAEFVTGIRSFLNLSLAAAGMAAVAGYLVAVLWEISSGSGLRDSVAVGINIPVIAVAWAIFWRLLIWLNVLGGAWPPIVLLGILTTGWAVLKYFVGMGPTGQLGVVWVVGMVLLVAGAARVASMRCERVFVRRICDRLFP